MVQDGVRIEKVCQLIAQGQRQLETLEPRVMDRVLRDDYLAAARQCLIEARDVMKTLEGGNASAIDQRQALLAAETIVSVFNRQIRLLLVQMLDTYGPSSVSLNWTHPA